MSDVASGVFRVASKQIPEQNNKSAILFPFRKRNRNAEYMLLLMLIKQLEILTFYTGSLLLYFHTKREYFMCGFFFQGFVCVSKCTSTISYPQTLACRWCKSTGRLSLWAQWNNIFLLATDPHSARRNLGDKIRERERKMTISFVIAH